MRENTDLRQSMIQVAGSAAFAGALMVFLGFSYFSDLTGVSKSDVYNASIIVFKGLLRLGGIAMLGIAALAYLGWRPVLAIDTVIAGATGLVMIVVGLIWLVNQDTIDGILLVLFGGMFVRSGLGSWALFRSGAPPELERTADEAPVPVDEPTRCDTSAGEELMASLLSSRKRAAKQTEQVAMPEPGKPEPEGFLADFGREEENRRRGE